MVAALLLTACQPNRFVSGWITYWSATGGRATVGDSTISPLFSEVSLLWYGTTPSGSTTADGKIHPLSSTSNLATTVATIRGQGLPVIPTIFDSAAAGQLKGILADQITRADHEQQILNLVTSQGYDGIDLDYEVFAFGDHITKSGTQLTTDWVNFVHELATLLHDHGKVLSVTVPPVWNGGSSGYTVYAQDQIADAVDRLRLMVYDFNIGSPGPLAPMSWVNSVIAYSSAKVPASKLQLGVPTYGRHWATQKNSKEVCPDGALSHSDFTMKETAGLAAAHKVTPVRDPAGSGELTFSWDQVVTGRRTKPITPPVWTPPTVTIPVIDDTADTVGLQPAVRLAPPETPVTCTVHHVVFAPDAGSVRQRADAAVAAHWSGIILFALGYETTDIYSSLAGVGAQRPDGLPTATLDAVQVDGSTVHITGQAWHPEFDLPVAVHLTLTPTGGGAAVYDETVTADTVRDAVPAGLGPYHGFDVSVPNVLPGSYQACSTLVLWGGVTGTSGCQPVTVT